MSGLLSKPSPAIFLFNEMMYADVFVHFFIVDMFYCNLEVKHQKLRINQFIENY